MPNGQDSRYFTIKPVQNDVPTASEVDWPLPEDHFHTFYWPPRFGLVSSSASLWNQTVSQA
jgi:hypothetical protein